MQIDKALISKLEKLAKLELTSAEQDQLIVDLNNILAMVEKMNEVDTTGVEPLTYINEAENVWRADEVKALITRVEALKNAPEKTEAFFKVPKVIDLKKKSK